MLSVHRTIMVLVILGLSAGAARSQSASSQATSLFGIDATGSLIRYDLGADGHKTVGVIRLENGRTLTGIAASAHFPGFQQMHAIWLDPADSKSKLVHIDTETAQAQLTGVVLGTNPGRGAAAVINAADDSAQSVYRIFAVEILPSIVPAITGQLYLDSAMGHMDLTVVTPTREIRGADLKVNTPADEQGVHYRGPASSVRVRFKGSRPQAGLIVNGAVFPIANDRSYEFSGELTVRIFNNLVRNSKLAGEWWLAIDATVATVNVDGVPYFKSPTEPTAVGQLVAIHSCVGLPTIVVPLYNAYHGLATRDGREFFAITSDNRLFRIDPAQRTEQLVATLSSTLKLSDLAFNDSALMAFDRQSKRLVTINSSSGAVTIFNSYTGLSDLTTLAFTPTEDVPGKFKLAFD